MKNNELVKTITLGGIFSAIYAVVTVLSVYVLNILSVIGLFIMPIFAAYFASVYNAKETLVFNLATMIICFLCGISDPFYSLLYVLPTLIVGDMFGLLYHLHLKYYTTIFLQSITYSITNILALYLGEIIYQTKIIQFIIQDEWIYNNLSLSILFILSGAEAIFSCMFIDDQLKKINLLKEKEKEIPFYCYIAIVVLFILAGITYAFSKNFYFLFFVMMFFLLIPVVWKTTKKMKHLNLVLIVYALVTISLEFLLSYYQLYNLFPVVITCPFVIYSIVKIGIYIYNIKNGSVKQ